MLLIPNPIAFQLYLQIRCKLKGLYYWEQIHFLLHTTKLDHLVYVTNQGDNTLSVINPEDRDACEITHIPVGSHPAGVLYVPNSKSIYITNSWSNTVSVIKPGIPEIENNSCRNNQIRSIQVGINPANIQIDAKNNVGYVANSLSNNISIINLNSKDPSVNVKEIAVGKSPIAVAVNSSTHTVYVANQDDNTVSSIAIFE